MYKRQLEHVDETRVEVVLERRLRTRIVDALRAAHPYEEVALNLHEMADLPSRTGLGRVGVLPEPEPLHVFAQRVADALPETVQGVRASGDPDRMIHRDSLLKTATAAGVDAFVTADLRHHPASDHAAGGDAVPALVDVAHWASEWPWCEQAAGVVRAAFDGTVDVLVSTRRTDPWTVGATSRTRRTNQR